jgi:hypothetical protein
MCIAVYIFVHNMDQMYIPNQSRLYRSDFKEILLENNEKGHSAQISLSKKRWKALDHEANRCEAQSQNPGTSACITDFIENSVGCTTSLYKSSSKPGFPCDQILLFSS